MPPRRKRQKTGHQSANPAVTPSASAPDTSLQAQLSQMIKDQVQAATADIIKTLQQGTMTNVPTSSTITPQTDQNAPTLSLGPHGSGMSSGSGQQTSQDAGMQQNINNISMNDHDQDKSIATTISGNNINLEDMVDLKIKEQIWSEKLPTLAILLKPCNNNATLIAKLSDDHTLDGQPIILPTPKHNNIRDFDEWLQAFFIFVAVYCQKYPDQVGPLMKYADTIRSLSRLGGNWKFYDETFRKLRPVTGWPWNTFQHELWQRATTSNQLRIQPFRANRQKTDLQDKGSYIKGTFCPVGFCFKFHAGEQCGSNCRFSHDCWKCMGQHRAQQCKKQSSFSKTGPKTPVRDPIKSSNTRKSSNSGTPTVRV